MDLILNALRDNVTPRSLLRALMVSVLVVGSSACTNSPSGGGGGILCALDGTCPAGMTCGGQYCLVTSQDVSSGSDSGATVQDSGATVQDSGATTTDSGGTTPDTNTTSQDTGVAAPDTTAPPKDTGAAGQDTTTAPDTSVTPGANIGTLQQATSSKNCAKTNGELSIMKDLTLTDVVATASAEALGKLMVFYVRPSNAPAADGRWQGMKVVVFGGKSTVKAGDILTLSGELVEYFCETEIKVNADKITVTGKANLLPNPYDVVVAEVSSKGLQSESYEGVYVQLKNVEVVEPNLLGTDGKPHGQFGVASVGATTPLVAIGGSAGTNFSMKDPKTGNTVTKMTKGKVFKTITGHLTYSFETYVLRPSSDSDLVAQ